MQRSGGTVSYSLSKNKRGTLLAVWLVALIVFSMPVVLTSCGQLHKTHTEKQKGQQAHTPGNHGSVHGGEIGGSNTGGNANPGNGGTTNPTTPGSGSEQESPGGTTTSALTLVSLKIAGEPVTEERVTVANDVEAVTPENIEALFTYGKQTAPKKIAVKYWAVL